MTAFLAGMTSLALELVLVRLLAFFLASTADFLAIPLALLGLALGSMYAHFGHRGPPERLVSISAAAVLPVVVGSLVALFGVFDRFFYEVYVFSRSPETDALRLVVYGLILLPPFAVFGALFAGLFSGNPDRLGRLYAADLAGAAFGCLLTPVLLTLSGLPAALLGVVAGALVLTWVAGPPRRLVRLAAGALFAAVVAGVAAGVLFRETPDPTTLAHAVLRGTDGQPVVSSLRVRWNEIARTALVRIARTGRTQYFVVQDNGLSNVTLQAWPPTEAATTAEVHDLPWRLGRSPERVLVLFAGAGRDMMNFDRLSDGKADITGVELNPAVRNQGVAVRKLKIGEFLAKPNIHLVIQEGRDFLDHDRGTYDLIYVANNGAVIAGRTGHTRKFLDTREAMSAYLDHLAPDGLLVFANQPVAEKITSFRGLFEEAGLGDFGRAAFVWGKRPELQTLVIAKAGFTPLDLPALEAEAGESPVLFRPGETRLDRLEAPTLVTDDRPFTHGLRLSLLRLDPRSRPRDLAYTSSWVKVFTVALFTVLSAAAGLVV
ncbi:MAG: class I SAM-dependent methyltransferase, partial [Myxococcota bacterium]